MGRDSQLLWPDVLRDPELPPSAAPPAAPLTWRATARAILPAFLLTRLVTLVAGAGAVLVWGTKPVQSVYDPAGLTVGLGRVVDTLVAPYARWDAVWFLDIAHVGYPTSYAPRTAFFPLYPGLIDLGGDVLGSPLIAGLLLSFVAAFGAAMLLHRLTERELGRRAATVTVWALFAFPGSLWLTAVYSEGLFLLLAVGCVYAARERWWLTAGILGALAAATRSAGIVLLAPILVMGWQHYRADRAEARSTDPRKARWPIARPARASFADRWGALLAAAAVPLGTLSFVVGLWIAGFPLTTSFAQQREWGRENVGPISGVWRSIEAAGDGVSQLLGAGSGTGASTPGAEWMNPLLLLALIGALVVLVDVARRLPPAYAVFVAAALLMPLSAPAIGGGEPLMSFPRFLAVLFPLAMGIGSWLTRGRRQRARQIGLLVVGLVLLAGVSALTARWSFVA